MPINAFRAVSDKIESILLTIGAAATRKTARHDAVASCEPSDKVDARRSPTPMVPRGGGRLCGNAGGLRLDHSYGYALHRTSWLCRKSAPPEWFNLNRCCSNVPECVNRPTINTGGEITAVYVGGFSGFLRRPVVLAAFRVRTERVMTCPKKVVNAVLVRALFPRHASHRERVPLI